MNWHETLAALSACREADLSEYLTKRLTPAARCSVSPLKNVYAHLPGDSDYTVLLDAHVDEVKMLVTGVDEDGFVRVGPCGGLDRRILPGCEVTVWGECPLYGVFCSVPPHLKKDDAKAAPKWNETGVDVGLSREQASTLIQPGDAVTFRCRLTDLQNGRVAAKSMDNRAGAAILLRVAEWIGQRDKPLPVSVVFQFSQLEETSRMAAGAVTGAFQWQPQEALVVDASFADYPGAQYSNFGGFGKGVMIGHSPLLSDRITRRLRALASQRHLPFVEEVMGGRTGTNADHLAAVGAGIPAGLLSYPIRNMHTPVESVDPADLETAAQLICAYLAEGGVCA